MKESKMRRLTRKQLASFAKTGDVLTANWQDTGVLFVIKGGLVYRFRRVHRNSLAGYDKLTQKWTLYKVDKHP